MDVVGSRTLWARSTAPIPTCLSRRAATGNSSRTAGATVGMRRRRSVGRAAAALVRSPRPVCRAPPDCPDSCLTEPGPSGLVPQRSSRKELNSSKNLRKFLRVFSAQYHVSNVARGLQEGYQTVKPYPPQCPPLFLFWAENGRILLLILPSREGTE